VSANECGLLDCCSQLTQIGGRLPQKWCSAALCFENFCQMDQTSPYPRRRWTHTCVAGGRQQSYRALRPHRHPLHLQCSHRLARYLQVHTSASCSCFSGLCWVSRVERFGRSRTRPLSPHACNLSLFQAQHRLHEALWWPAWRRFCTVVDTCQIPVTTLKSKGRARTQIAKQRKLRATRSTTAMPLGCFHKYNMHPVCKLRNVACIMMKHRC
jgi:hypothetical protein